MKSKPSKEYLFESLLIAFDRLSPCIITEIDNPYYFSLLEKILPRLNPFVLLEHIKSPKMLFDFLKEHQKELVIIKDDIFSKRKNYRDIVQGAVCSSPDSMALWSVYYLNEKEFTFKGRILLCSNKTKEQIKSDKKFFYFTRDCRFI